MHLVFTHMPVLCCVCVTSFKRSLTPLFINFTDVFSAPSIPYSQTSTKVVPVPSATLPGKKELSILNFVVTVAVIFDVYCD